VWAVAVTILVPFVLSFLWRGHLTALQLAGLFAGLFWLFVCGFFTAVNPLPIAHWFARPGTYDLMLRDKRPAFTRVYFAVAGAVMMLVALVLASVFWLTRNPVSTGAHS
jgi:hypothetical protein